MRNDDLEPFEDDGDIVVGESPDWANNEELKKLNAKMDQISQQLGLMVGHLQAISINTRAKPNFGSSYKP